MKIIRRKYDDDDDDADNDHDPKSLFEQCGIIADWFCDNLCNCCMCLFLLIFVIGLFYTAESLSGNNSDYHII